MQRASSHGRRMLCAAAPIALTAIGAFVFRSALSETLQIVLGGALTAFFAEPLAKLYERRLHRSTAALCALLTILALFAAAAWLLLPALIREASHLTRIIPEALSVIQNALKTASEWAELHLSGIDLPEPDLGNLAIPSLAKRTIVFAGNVADSAYRLSLSVILGFFFLADRERLLLRLELLVPQATRPTAVRMGNAVLRELRLYLRGQCMIALAVGALAAAGLWLIGVESSLALGVVVGVFNMIPYFGPIIGGVPAVLSALSGGWPLALMAIGVLWLVQQLDGMLISPRIMANLTGVSPAMVLLAIFAGSKLGGVVGMLTALPLVMTFRTVYRIYVQRHENV